MSSFGPSPIDHRATIAPAENDPKQAEDSPRNERRWTERGCAPSRGDGNYYFENSAEGPVETRDQVPEGLVQRLVVETIAVKKVAVEQLVLLVMMAMTEMETMGGVWIWMIQW